MLPLKVMSFLKNKNKYLKNNQISEGNHDPSLDIFLKKYLKYKSKYVKLKEHMKS